MPKPKYGFERIRLRIHPKISVSSQAAPIENTISISPKLAFVF